eukprot:gene15939-24208_t
MVRAKLCAGCRRPRRRAQLRWGPRSRWCAACREAARRAGTVLPQWRAKHGPCAPRGFAARGAPPAARPPPQLRPPAGAAAAGAQLRAHHRP